MDFQCNANHKAIAEPGLRVCRALFGEHPHSSRAFFRSFVDSLSAEQQKAVREFLRTMRWWQSSVWLQTEESLKAFTHEENELYRVAGFKEVAAASPPMKQLNTVFNWGCLEGFFKQSSKSSSTENESFVLCIKDSAQWRRGNIDQSLYFTGHFALAYFGHDFMHVRCGHVLTDSSLIERNAAHDMCYLLNALLSQYNTEFSFTYQILKDVGSNTVSLELFGQGELIGNIVPGFKALRSLMPEGAQEVGIYQFLHAYSALDKKEKHELFVLGNLLYEASLTHRAMRAGQFPHIGERQCIVCLLPSSMEYGYSSEICFCSMFCLRSTIGPMLDLLQAKQERKQSKNVQ